MCSVTCKKENAITNSPFWIPLIKSLNLIMNSKRSSLISFVSTTPQCFVKNPRPSSCIISINKRLATMGVITISCGRGNLRSHNRIPVIYWQQVIMIIRAWSPRPAHTPRATGANLYSLGISVRVHAFL